MIFVHQLLPFLQYFIIISRVNISILEAYAYVDLLKIWNGYFNMTFLIIKKND